LVPAPVAQTTSTTSPTRAPGHQGAPLRATTKARSPPRPNRPLPRRQNHAD
jgi:hypothetical protein